MVTRWDGENLLVKLTGILRYCCEQVTPNVSSNNNPRPALPQGYLRGHYVEEPRVITDPDPWSQFMINHRLDTTRFTLLPTITVVPPWEENNETNSLFEDQDTGGSIQQAYYITPTPVASHSNVLDESSHVGGAVVNATQRFYDALRVVLHGGIPSEAPALSREEANVGVDAKVAGFSPNLLDTPRHHITSTQLDPEVAMSPILQVCAALSILVVIMVILFHTHHFRRDCMTERRAVRRVARRYQVAKAQDDVEKCEEVTDVTL